MHLYLNLAAILDCCMIMLMFCWASCCKVYKLVVNFVDFKLQVLVDMLCIFLYKHDTVERHTLNISLYYKYFIENVKDFFSIQNIGVKLKHFNKNNLFRSIM